MLGVEGVTPPKQQGSKSPSGKHVPSPSTSSTSRSSSIKCLDKGHIALHCPNKKTKFFRTMRLSIMSFLVLVHLIPLVIMIVDVVPNV